MKKQTNQTIYKIALMVYCIAILIFTLFRRPYLPKSPILYFDYIERNIQIVPFLTIIEMIQLILDTTASAGARLLAVINISGNLALFVPCGILFPRVFSAMNQFSVFIRRIAFGIIGIELLQLFLTIGSFDIDDILLNTFGAILGFYLNSLLNKYQMRKDR